MGFARPINSLLTAPLTLPVEVGKSLTTASGTVLDDGNGNLELSGSGHVYASEISTGSGVGVAPLKLAQGQSNADYLTVDNYGNLTANAGLGSSGHFNPWPSTPSLPANPPVSGTVYQNTSGGPIFLSIPITATAIGGSAQLALGATDTPSDWGGAEQIGVSGETHNVSLMVPNTWYWSVTVSNATIGTASVLGQ